MVGSRAAYLAANNAWMSNARGNLVAYLVGTGARPTARNVSRQERRQVQRRFETWAARADFLGRTDFFGLQQQVANDLVVYGESLVLMHDEPEGLQLQVIAPDHLDASKTAQLGDGRMIVNGVEFDARGRRLGYWVLPDRPHSTFAEFAPAVRVDARDVCHIFHPIGSGQVRGLSWFAPAILPANELDQLTDALLVAAKLAAMHAAFVTDVNDTATDEHPLEDPVWEPGAITRLPFGTDVKFSSPDQVKEAPALVRMNLQALAAALGLPEHLVSGDLSNANYSSLRAGLMPFRARMEQVQYATLAPQFLRPVWERWLTREVLLGELDIPADTPADWIMPRPQQVDPLKDMEATEKALALGLTSRRQAVNEAGWLIDDLDEEILADREREAELGLSFTTSRGEPDAA
ncbi:hypothetical protein ATO3_25540 [Marinibacterium profundimaris]|uniref:Portal protein n=2 Tax=Marinibacterium profundimaris TaxID=1679460 RepID=A0A225NFN7_9RHOB|nr:hypothetical protein ATO3_25540 [Marinibacterium profundimaris]